MIKIVLASFLFLFHQSPQRIDPNGIWESSTGTRFELKLSGSNLSVTLVPLSNPQFVEYKLALKNTENVNTYEGEGYFVVKVSETKECRFDTEWHLVVTSTDSLSGVSLAVLPDPETCAAKDSRMGPLELKKKS